MDEYNMSNLEQDKLYQFIMRVRASKLFHILVGLCSFAICGSVFWCLWMWFVVPLGMPEISLVHAIGLDVFITFATTTFFTNDDIPYLERCKKTLTFAWSSLIIGFILQFFV